MSEITAEQRALKVYLRVFRMAGRTSADDKFYVGEITTAIREAVAAAELAQLERDCAAVCTMCATPKSKWLIADPVRSYGSTWWHTVRVSKHDKEVDLEKCGASSIRAAYAAQHAPVDSAVAKE